MAEKINKITALDNQTYEIQDLELTNIVNGIQTSISDIPTELSSNYSTSNLTNEDLALDSGDTFEEAFGKLEKAILDNEKIIGAALNDLNGRINDNINVQADWEESDSTSDAYIANKPTYALGTTEGGAANMSVGIPYGTIQSGSTATNKIATVNDIIELKTGTICIIKNDGTNSATNWTLNVNGLGAKPVFVTTAATTRSTTQFTANYTIGFIYDESLDSNNGGWRILQLFNTNTTYSNMSQTEANTGTAATARSISAKVLNTTINNKIKNKIDKIEGKGLSTQDYTTEEKTKLAGIQTGAEVNVQSDWEESDSTSDAYIANKPFETVNSTQFVVDSTTKELSINKDILPVDYSKQYLTFECLSAGTITIKASNASGSKTISYSTDDGSTWTSLTTSTTEQSLATFVIGDKVLIKGTNDSYGTASYYNQFGGTAQVKVYGNIMSLIYGDNFIGQTTLSATYTFNGLFRDNANLASAENLVLPATTLKGNCYDYMFYGCTSLVNAPSELPATTSAQFCYRSMFQNCTNLVSIPSVLPAITLTQECYENMFKDCTSLVTTPELPATTLALMCYASMFRGCTRLTQAPELPATTLTTMCYVSMFSGCTRLTQAPELPATTLGSYCYEYMFYNCTSLTNAPELPATTLSSCCYEQMFYGCTNLISAPELPATTLATGCYRSMFEGCTNLNYIKCLATDITASNCTSNWVKNVNSTGTFIKNPNMSSWTTGYNGILSGWNVYTESQWKEVKHYELDALEDSLDDIHETISASLNDLNDRLVNIVDEVDSIDIPSVELSNNYAPSSDSNADLFLAPGDTFEEAFGKLEKSINDNEQITSAALNDLNERVETIEIGTPMLVELNSNAISDTTIVNRFKKMIADSVELATEGKTINVHKYFTFVHDRGGDWVIVTSWNSTNLPTNNYITSGSWKLQYDSTNEVLNWTYED